MNVTRNNLAIVTVAAWVNWQEQAGTFLASAEKNRLDVTTLDRGESWQGFYHHKIEKLAVAIAALRKTVKYVIVTDCRDVVITGGIEEIAAGCKDFDDDKVYFSTGKPGRVWPFSEKWFLERIAICYRKDGVVNGGGYIGERGRIAEMLHRAKACQNELERRSRKTALHEKISVELDKSYDRQWMLKDDQFLFHCLQAEWMDDLIDVDRKKSLFATFDAPLPSRIDSTNRFRHPETDLGTATFLHSPWFLVRNNVTQEKLDRWKEWAEKERII